MMAAAARLPAGARRNLLAICTMTATIMQALDTTIANVALPYMQGSLSASLDQISWVLTSYIVAAAVMTAPVGWLADRFGRKKLFIVCVAGFTFASLLCALSQSIAQIVAFRLLQGMCGAALVPLSQSVMLDAYPIEQRGQAMGIWGVGVMLGPIMGPTLGGFLTDNYSWHWVFLVNIPVGILTVIGLLVFMDETRRHEHLRFDWFGFIALAAGIGSLQLMLDRGEQLGWFTSPEIIAELIVSMVGFYYFFAHSLTTPEPFVRFAIFRDRNFLIACFFMVIMGLMLFSSMALSTPFIQNILGYPITTAGWVLASRGIGTLVGMLLIGRLLRLIEARYLILVGLTLTATTLYQMTGFTQNTSKHEIVMCGLVQGFGMGFVFIPLSTVAFLTLPQRFRTDGTAMLTLVRNVASSIGISVVIANLSSKTTVFYSQLAERITPFNDALQSPDVTRWLDLATEQGRALADQMMTLQAAIMAYAVDYALLAAICALAIPFVLAIGSTASLRRQEGRCRGDRVVVIPGRVEGASPEFMTTAGATLTVLWSWVPGRRCAATRNDSHPNSFRTFSVCSPRPGTRPYRRGWSRIAAGAGYDTGPLGVSTLMRRRCGCAMNPATSLTRAKAMSAASSFLASASASMIAKKAATLPSVSGRRFIRSVTVANCGSAASAPSPMTSSASMRHSRSFWIEMRMSAPSPVWNTP